MTDKPDIGFKKYENPDPRCKLTQVNGPMDYCWSFAHHVDGTEGFEDMEAICKSCEYFVERASMTIKVGTNVGTDFGNGLVVAITNEWVIINLHNKRGEVALHREDDPVWIVATGYEIGGGQELTIETSGK